jgi:hypothetical protein
MLSARGSRTKSAHHVKMARKSWDNTPDRTARTAPGRIAAARAVVAALEAQTGLGTDADPESA